MVTSKNVFNKKKIDFTEIYSKLKRLVALSFQKTAVRVSLAVFVLVLTFLLGMYFQKYISSKAGPDSASYQMDSQVRQRSVVGIVDSVSSEGLTLNAGGASMYDFIVTADVKISGGREIESLSQLTGKRVVAYYLSTTDGRRVLKRVNILR